MRYRLGNFGCFPSSCTDLPCGVSRSVHRACSTCGFVQILGSTGNHEDGGTPSSSLAGRAPGSRHPQHRATEWKTYDARHRTASKKVGTGVPDWPGQTAPPFTFTLLGVQGPWWGSLSTPPKAMLERCTQICEAGGSERCHRAWYTGVYSFSATGTRRGPRVKC